ncbi:MAG: DEAD/DEAH box helicase [Deltaproteobacteria bacterium]|nr:DEAD/DEAH box helicase [Deltaproteobacteria bacterium]
MPARLRSAFARGHWLTGVRLLFPDAHGVPRVMPRDGWWLDAGQAAIELATIPLSHLSRLSPSVGVWTLASKWTVELVASEQVVPVLVPGPESDSWLAQWRVAPVRLEDRKRLLALAQSMPGVARACPLDEQPRSGAARRSGIEAKPETKSEGRARAERPAAGTGTSRSARPTSDTPATNGHALQVRTAVAALQEFADAAADGLMRASTELETPKHPRGTQLTWAVRLASALAGPNARFDLHGVLESHIPENLRQWVAPATTIGATGRPVIGFRIAEPKNARGPWLLSYHLHPDGGDERIPASELANPSTGLREVIARMVRPEETLLEALGRCSNVFEPIARSLTHKLPASVSVSASEAWDFITSKGLQLERAGYVVEMPAALSKVGHRRVRARMRIGEDQLAGDGAGGAAKTGLLAGLVNYRWEACLGDDTLTQAEFQELVKSKAPLVHHRGQWIALDPTDVQRLQALIGEGQGHIDTAEALRLALTGEVALPHAPDTRAEVICEGHVKGALLALRGGIEQGPQELPPPASLNASLRPYQLRGFAWLRSITDLGFGACLADDMGLGKTVQLLGLFADLAERGSQPGTSAPETDRPTRFLVVCPTSVLGNWRREIRRFFPRLGVVLHHGPGRAHSIGQLEERLSAAVVEPRSAETQRLRSPVCVLTSYALGRRDRELLGRLDFECVVLDEAQNIKNPDAAQSQAVRLLNARRKIALTGTPVENRLTELWSIVDFLNPGLLGGQTAFKRQFAIPIERYADEGAADLLKKITAPFILRRMKIDPAIAPELPDKVETTRYCPLTREQAALYQSTIDRAMDDIVGLELGMERRGRILSMITQIKQICNHPAQFLKDHAAAPRRSGKLTRLLQLIDEVFENDAAALVFTQYREMGNILEKVLTERIGRPIPFLHGGLSRTQRDEMVQTFQTPAGPPIMVVSLRAGGTGLNLTRANHVFHYDRWWNPAVEDQATDRAFRIGQTRDVTVHRLVSQGTFEEQIHQLLEEKRALAGKVVGEGETWLSELDDDTLKSLIALGQDAVLEEADARHEREDREEREELDRAEARRELASRSGGFTS